jgi:hypothetical protein
MQPTPTLRLRLEPWLAIHEKAGRVTGRARSAHVGMDHSLVSRIEHGTVRPGNQFIASVKLAFPGKTIDYFFEAVREDAK